ncbi:Pectin methylesterase [Microlunatus sagamiharensis]|uniref:Pectin methylesterase n=1 Tax=Microlunatus sagamiharensis TaxID=546874 RepID=A0A1H2M5E3_9ACTN|nr:pectinesterase family protein [Microlunatus sagamiharensis]SDU88480.1 Pectin methylesterase [Microlunatus sagamiharensis]
MRSRASSHVVKPARGLVRGLVVTATAAGLVVGIAPSATAADTTPPPVPSSVKTVYYGGVGTQVSWGKVSASDLDTYVVYRSTSKTLVPATDAVGTTTSLTLTDAKAVAGTTYYYGVAARDKSGNVSKPSSVQTVKATDTSAPSTPSSLKATATSGGIALDWADVAVPDLAGYKVARAASSSGTYTTLTSSPLSTSAFTDASAPAGATAYYRVTAVDRTGNASSAASVSAKAATAPAPSTAPAAPTGLKATVSSANVVTLAWTAPSGSITGYTLSRSTSSTGTFATVASPASTATSVTDSSAPAGTTVYYRLVATNAVGSSPAATVSAATSKDTTAPATPSSPKAVVVAGGGGMTVSWTANKEADLAGYLVLKRNGAGDYVTLLGADRPFVPTTFTDPSVTEGKVAYFRIRAVDTSGNVSSYVSLTANNPNVAPKAPASLKATVSTKAGIDLTWAAPTDTDVAGYNVYRSVDAGKTYPLLATATAAAVTATPRFADTSAPQGVKSMYKITAQDVVGNLSSASTVVSATSTTAPVALPVVTKTITVGPAGQFPTIGAALATIPATNLESYTLEIAPGTYREKLRLSSPNVTLHGTGAGPGDTVITYDAASGTIDPTDGEPYGTANSYTVFAEAKNLKLANLSVVNAFDEAAHPEITSQQAVALRVEGDRFVADGVRLIGNQDTLLADTPKPTTRIRQYYVNSYIEGDVDYLFGAADAVFDRVTLRSLDRGKSDNGAITAASTDTGSKYGFLVVDSKVVSSAAAGTVHLGRPWHPSADPDAIGSVVYKNTWLPAAIATDQPWEDMATANSSGTKVNFRWQDARFSEYRNIGPGALPTGAVNANRPQLTDSNAANATPAKYLAGSDGWNPVLPAATTTPAAPAGLAVTTDNRVAHLAWADDSSAAVVGWKVYRSEKGVETVLGTVDRPAFSDSSAVNGAIYSYSVAAISRSGAESARSAAVTVTIAAAPLVVDLVVDPAHADGVKTFATLGAALAAAPAGTAADPTVISVVPGRYAEYLTIAKPYVTVVGSTGTASDVVITGNRAAGTPTGGKNDDGTPATYGTSGSATLLVTGTGDSLRDLTVENAYKEGTYANGQAVAMRSTGDKLVFDNIRLLGNQDTLYANSAGTTVASRQYFHDCYVEGDVDYLFGRATAVFDGCVLRSLDHGSSPNGAVTAASTDTSQKYGFLITRSRFTGTAPDGSQNLGRPWQPGQAQADGTSVADKNAVAQVVVRDSWLGPVVSTTQTWTDMVNSGTTTHWQDARFAEWANSGPGALPAGTTSAGRPQLSAADAAAYTPETYLAGADGWNPVVDAAPDVAPAGVTGLTAGADDGLVTLAWDDSTEPDVTGYRVYRAEGGTVTPTDATLVATVVKPTFADKGVVNGTAYAYTVVAVDAAGHPSAAAAPVTVTPNPQPLVADLTVAKDGSGDYTSLQAALTAANAGTAAKPTVILVKPGTYHEVVASTKANLVVAGTTGDPRDVRIEFDNANGTAVSASTCPQVTNAATCGTSGSYTVFLSGSNVKVSDLTIANTFDRDAHPEIGNFNTQAVALRMTGDRQVYRNVRLLGVQDTVLADAQGNISSTGTGYPRQYVVGSYVEGNVDFVFGRATTVFDRTTIHATSHNGGTVFAPSTASKNPYGYLVVNSRIVSDNDPGTFALGRPWRGWGDGTQPDSSRGQTTIRNTWIGEGISTAQPWVDFAPNVWTDGRFSEYANSGPGALAAGAQNGNRPQLSDAQAADATAQKYLAGTDGWNPVAAAAPDTAPAAPRGLSAKAGDAKVSLTWDESGEPDVVGYRVLRDGTQVGGTLTRASYTDAGLTNGTAVGYTVVAVDAAGHVSAASATASATPQLKVDAVVATDGSGDYRTVQAAVDAGPANGPWLVKVMPGTYAGTTTIAKSGITVVGSTGDPADVVLTNATATPTLTVSGSSVTVRALSVTNSAGVSNSPAVSMTGDKVLLDRTTLTSTDRTVWADVPTAGATSRQLIEGSTVSGANNVVLGRATLVVHATTLVATKTSGTLLVPSTTGTNGHGFLVIGSTVAPAAGVSDVRLGAGYAQGTTTAANAPEAVVRDTVLNAGIKAQVWQDFNGYKWVDGRFAEYANSGAGSGVTDLRPQLSPAASVGYTVAAWLGAPTWYAPVADPATPADVTAPATPAGLVAAGADTRVDLTWTADPDAASYRLYRAVGTSVVVGPGTLVRSGITGGAFSSTGLANGTTYTWALVAVDAAGNTSVAATVAATPADSLPPAAPVGVKAGAGDSRVVLTWTANGEPDLAGYRVYAAGATTHLNDALLKGATFTQTGLVNGTAYAYEVTAVDAQGNESARSAVATGTPAAGDTTPPAVPTGVTTVLGKGSVAVAWSKVDDADLASYDVLRSSGGDPATVVGAGVTATRWSDTTAVVGTTYTYTVRATDTAGNASDASTGAKATPVKADVVVAADGSGDATTVAGGIALLADNADYTAQGYRTVLVQPGTYAGAVSSGNRYGVRLVGATTNAADTVLTAPGGAVATLTISGKGWTVSNLTLASVATAAGAQATALQIKAGDQQVVDNVRMLGDKQTLLVSTANATTFSRVYVRNSHLEGGADLVLGRAVTVIERSTIHVLNRPGASLTDSSVDAASPYGFLVTGSTIVTDGNPGSVFLGRPYSTQGKAQVVVRETELGSALATAGPWKDWDAATPWTAGRFFEYKNTGPGAEVVNPATRPQLSDADAAAFTAKAYLAGTDGWNPTA